MKTTRLAFIFGLLAAGILSAQTAIAPTEGNGLSGNPYRIASLDNLYWIAATDVEVPDPDRATRWAAHYLQTENIDASETSTWVGGGWTPIGSSTTPFTGSYDGGDRTIDSLYINRSANYQGLFGNADSALFENLGLTGVSITSSSASQYFGGLLGRMVASTIRSVYTTGSIVTSNGDYLGGLAGQIGSNSLVTGCHSTASVSGWNAGSLVGYNSGSTIEDSYATGLVSGDYAGGLTGFVSSSGIVRNCYSTGNVTGLKYNGGLVGIVEGSSVFSNCYSRGTVSRSSGTATSIGGFAGQISNSTIAYCFSTGAVNYGTDKGFIGSFGSNVTATANFFDSLTTGQSSSPGAEPRTTAWMKNHDNFIAAGWDFEAETENGTDNHWDMDYSGTINDGYPYLSWEDGDDTSLEQSLVWVRLSVFLEGPYHSGTGEMNTALTVPVTSPYSEDPRTVDPIPADIVDWVLVQLRGTADGAAVSSKSALLHGDGRIVGDDGTTSEFQIAGQPGDYYIVVRHRNHAAVMTAEAQALSGDSSTLYDFTTGSGRYYSSGGAPAKEIQTGVWGLWAGDVNQDGVITTTDYTAWYNSARLGDSGYRDTDINMDGEVTTSDYTMWYNNARLGAASEVP